VTDYELEYQRSAAACGEPFPEFEELFQTLPVASTILDMGAGQGRDTLVAARLGHKVVAVDISPTGISQILDAAKTEKLSVEGVVADLTTYVPNEKFDVVVLDRIVHMFKNIKDKKALLSKAADATAENGYILIADTPSNREYIDWQFGDRKAWKQIESKKGRRIFKREFSAT
jgi:SAM-dependent methyltransferase